MQTTKATEYMQVPTCMKIMFFSPFATGRGQKSSDGG